MALGGFGRRLGQTSVACFALGATPAFAQDAATPEAKPAEPDAATLDARRHFKSGTKLYRDGNYGGALAEFEEAVGDVFVAKTRMALEETNAQTFVIGGGVAANTYLRERLQKLLADEFPNVELRLPELSITGDNAIMIAQCALARALSGKNDAADDSLRAIGNLSIANK